MTATQTPGVSGTIATSTTLQTSSISSKELSSLWLVGGGGGYHTQEEEIPSKERKEVEVKVVVSAIQGIMEAEMIKVRLLLNVLVKMQNAPS